GRPCRGVLHLWSLDAADEVFDEALLMGCGSALHLVQALGRAGWRDLPQLWLVTRGTQTVAGAAPTSVAPGALWGLGRTLALEHAELRPTRVDLDPQPSEQDVTLLWDEIAGRSEDEEVAWRHGRRYAGRLVRGLPAGVRLPEHVALLRPDASYLITGGLGGLARALCRWLVAGGARYLVLVSRRGAADGASASTVAELEASGAKVTVCAADVADRGSLGAVLESVSQSMPPVAGIFHTAVGLADAVVSQLSLADLRQGMAAKALGAWNLHVLTASSRLDFFVLYSSGSALLGHAGAAGYAAANTFLDTLAGFRRGTGRPALSVNWGLFAQVGVGAGTVGERLQQGDSESLTAEEGLEVLGRLLAGDFAQMGVARVNMRSFVAFHPRVSRSPYFSRLLETEELRAPGGAFLTTLLAAPSAARAALLASFIQQQVGRVLRLDPTRLDPAAPFKSLGLDSLMGLEVRNGLEAGLGLTLPATLLWTYGNVTALTRHLIEQVNGSAAPEPDPVEDTPTQALTADEADALLETAWAQVQGFSHDT
ncbi:MAG TPA: beta-ketoacyl reductase, partial [Candidatus Xenobia bacterium]